MKSTHIANSREPCSKGRFCSGLHFKIIGDSSFTGKAYQIINHTISKYSLPVTSDFESCGPSLSLDHSMSNFQETHTTENCKFSVKIFNFIN